MKGFDLHEPTTVSQAVGLLNSLGATGKVLAGGSDLVGGVLKDWVGGKGMPLPSALVDITVIPDLRGIKATTGGISIAAATTLTELVDSPEDHPITGRGSQKRRVSPDPQLWHAGREHQPAAAVLVLPR
jgi:CO/xanthine dehydrogenase FAD-binding subunit